MQIVQSGFRPLVSPLSFKTPSILFWLGVSLLAPLYFGLISLYHVMSSGYLVQDDARLHTVWLHRLTDPALFASDPIATYYTAIQPVGFKGFYGLIAALGIDPVGFALVVPLILALIATVYLFWVALLILPVPMAGVLTTLLLNQNIWIKDDLISAAPRAFVYPLFSAFLYYLLQNSRVGTLVVLVLLGLFYPQMMLVALGILTLGLGRWRDRKLQLSRCWQDYGWWLIAFLLTGGLLLLFSTQVEQQVGRLTNVSEMFTWPEFQVNGRGEYFGVSFLAFWFDGSSGLRLPLFPPIIWLGVLLPMVVRSGWPRFALARYITAQVKIVAQILGSALGLFVLAHGLFPTLYLPSRYTFYSSRFAFILASGLMLTLVCQRWWHWLLSHGVRKGSWLNYARVVLSVGFAIAVLITPAIPVLFLGGQSWISGEPAAVYQALAETPKNSLVASLVTEVNDNVPAFSRRSVLTGREFALPFHVEFYGKIKKRAQDLVQAQYSPDLARVKSFIQTYGLDVWIVAQNFNSPAYLDQQGWLLSSSVRPAVIAARDQLQQGIQPALTQVIPVCEMFSDNSLIILDTHCIAHIGQKG